MKQIWLVFAGGVVVGVVVMVLLCTTGYMPLDCGCVPDDQTPGEPLDPAQGVVIDSTEFFTLMDSFDNGIDVTGAVLPPTEVDAAGNVIPPAEGTTPNPQSDLGKFGGKIGVMALMQLVSGIANPEDVNIYFRYGLKVEGEERKTFLMFYRKPNASVGSEALYMRSSDLPASFCPTFCNFDN